VSFDEFIKTGSFALSEGSVYERLRRHPGIEFDPYLAHAALIYDDQSHMVLEQIHREYLDIGQKHGLVMFTLTDTWRANQDRINQSKFKDKLVNQDNARFIAGLQQSYGPESFPIFIGGQIGPKGDAYTPEESLSAVDAEHFHAPQLEALAEGGVDFLYAATMPALTEAQGIAVAMAKLNLPFVLSFIIRKDGALLDGTPLAQAIETIDNITPKPPTGYALNCIYPTVFHEGMTVLENSNIALPKRILSFQANTSSRDPKELDKLEILETEEPEILADLMVKAYERFQTTFFGGCCGTDTRHIECLAITYKASLR